MIADADYAWAAGFFDGEGCTFAHGVTNKQGRTYYYLALVIHQKDRRVLDKFRAIFNFGKVYSDRRDMYLFKSENFDDVNTMMDLMWPHLGILKREQYEDALELVTNSRVKVLKNKKSEAS